MALPVTFVSGAILEAAQLNSNFVSTYADYVSFTPTVSGWTAGNMTFNAEYCVTGDMVHYLGWMNYGSTTTFAATGLSINLPVASSNSGVDVAGVSVWRDASTAARVAGSCQLSGASALKIYWHDPETAPLAVRLEEWSTVNTLPFTITTSDTISWNITYSKA